MADKKEKQIEVFEEGGFEAFNEDRRGINNGVKLRHVMELAIEDMSLGEISDATSLRERFLKRVIQYHGLDEYDAIAPQKSPPWEPRVRDDAVAKGSGSHDKTPWQ